MANEPAREELTGNGTFTARAQIIRGAISWSYFYIFLGFALSIEGTVIQMIVPLLFPCNILLFLVVGGITVYLVLFSGWFQGKLIGWKNWYENIPR